MGGGGSQETAVMVAQWRRSCRRPRFHAQINIEHTDDAAKALVYIGKVRGACLNICAAELKPLVGARQSSATG